MPGNGLSRPPNEQRQPDGRAQPAVSSYRLPGSPDARRPPSVAFASWLPPPTDTAAGTRAGQCWGWGPAASRSRRQWLPWRSASARPWEPGRARPCCRPRTPRRPGAVSGIATHYVLQGLPNCSYPSPPADGLFVALSPGEYDSAAACGGYLEVHGPDGSVRVEVIDQCPGCGAGHIDLSEAAFSAIAPLNAGLVNVTYQHARQPVAARSHLAARQAGLIAVLAGAAGDEHREPAGLGPGAKRIGRRLARPRPGQLQLLGRAVGRRAPARSRCG